MNPPMYLSLRHPRYPPSSRAGEIQRVGVRAAGQPSPEAFA